MSFRPGVGHFNLVAKSHGIRGEEGVAQDWHLVHSEELGVASIEVASGTRGEK